MPPDACSDPDPSELVRLFDIKYKGERIIYELGLQEAIAH
jgi:hypothetical protein